MLEKLTSGKWNFVNAGVAAVLVALAAGAYVHLFRKPDPHLFIAIEICPPDRKLTLPPAGEMSKSFLPLCDGRPLETKYLVNDIHALSNGLGFNGMLPWLDLGRYTHSGPPGGMY